MVEAGPEGEGSLELLEVEDRFLLFGIFEVRWAGV